ncbi:hypothetical protein ABFV05_017338 [Capra hircus]
MAEIRFQKRKVKHGGSPELKENRQHVSVPQLEGDSQEQFMGHLDPQRKPLVLKGIDLGACTSKWMEDFPGGSDGKAKEVKIHVAALVQRATEENHKEFFISEDLLALIEKTEKDNLGSLGKDPRKDLEILNFQNSSKNGSFPMFFKLSSPKLQLWIHYNVMDNFSIQVTGEKMHYNIQSSRLPNIDNTDLSKDLLFSKARWYECSLKAGDVLFIPFRVGVNVFWKHLPSELYGKMDTYGNKDPTAASRTAQILDRAFSSVQLPSQTVRTLCDPMNPSMPGLPVHHQLPEFTQTHVHRVSDAIQPSHPLSPPSALPPSPSQHQNIFQ